MGCEKNGTQVLVDRFLWKFEGESSWGDVFVS